MSPIDQHLADLADALGVRIEYARLPADRDGEYIHVRKLIRLRRGMHARHHRSVLAHELGHAAFGDMPTKFGPVHAKQERRAEEWAALRLIDVDAYRLVEQLHGGHAGAMAVDLGVMRTTVMAFRGLLTRLGESTYVDARMGAGQFAHRTEVA